MNRKKRGQPPPPRAAERPRGLAAARRSGRGYPALRRVLEAAALAAAGGLAAAGCADPVCSTSAAGELETHGKAGVEALVDLELDRGVEELGVGLGITPHPAPPIMAGEMPAPVPLVPPPAPIPPADEDEEPAL